MSESNLNSNQDVKLELYNDILMMVEEEIYQRRNGSGYKDESARNDAPIQTGGANRSQVNNFIPGKFEAVKYSMEVPLEVAVRGTIARQKLFAQEYGL